MVLAMTGLLLSLAVHIASILGLPIPGGKLVWSLHIGIFVVWLPAVLVGSRINRGKRRNELWKSVLAGFPNWMRYAGYALFGYALANFIWCYAVMQSGTPSEANPPLAEIRLFSGHWLVFYAAGFAILLSAYRNPRLLKKHRCLKGHDVSSIDAFCPKCGSKVQLDIY